MTKTTSGFDLRKAYPPMLATKYRKLVRQVVAEWMRAAGVTCEEDYHLSAVVEHIEAFVVSEMKNQTKEHRLWLGDILQREED